MNKEQIADRDMTGRPPKHPDVVGGKIGVLLINLGTPDEPTPKALRRYLREFLSDKRVVDLPRLIWLPILYGVILNLRAPASAKNYAKIWREESNESPLRYYTRRQAEKLSDQIPGPIEVSWAMRYGAPSIADRLICLLYTSDAADE